MFPPLSFSQSDYVSDVNVGWLWLSRIVIQFIEFYYAITFLFLQRMDSFVEEYVMIHDIFDSTLNWQSETSRKTECPTVGRSEYLSSVLKREGTNGRLDMMNVIKLALGAGDDFENKTGKLLWSSSQYQGQRGCHIAVS